MMTAFLIFFGISGCATLFLVGSVVIGARKHIPSMQEAALDAAEAVLPQGKKASTSFVPSYSH